jgi:hypothetical protein
MLAIIFTLGAAAGLLFVSSGCAWTLPFIATVTFGVAALLHTVAGKGPDEADIEAVKTNLWLRYHPRVAAERGAAGAREAVEADTEILERAAASADGASDRALAYVERVIDRQINKLRGVLSFDALIIAFLSLERQRIATASLGPDFATGCLLFLTLVLLMLVISSVMCLDLFRVIWSKPTNFQDFETEHGTTVKLVAERTKVVERAVRLSEIAVVGAVTCFLLIELQTAFIPPPSEMPPATSPSTGVQKKDDSAAPEALPARGAAAPPKGRAKARSESGERQVRPTASEPPKPSTK